MAMVMPFLFVRAMFVCDGIDAVLLCWLYDEAEMRGV